MGSYYESGTIQKLTVQSTGKFSIYGYGAQGGAGYHSAGGKGAEIGGSFNLQTGEVLELVVGQQGTTGTQTAFAGGGGGGTFVLADVDGQGNITPGHYSLLLAAGGGGGGAQGSSPNGGEGSVPPAVASGSGNGGASGTNNGGGGAGFRGNGSSGSPGNYGGYYGQGGSSVNSPTNPGAGGRYVSPPSIGNKFTGNGGFGGGGGGGLQAGGGGGGYTGGYGGQPNLPGGGGTSFFSSLGTLDSSRAIAGEKTGDGLVKITPDVLCFASGTLIRTTRGEVPVEALRSGDAVITASGKSRTVRWLGHRTIDCRRHPNPRVAMPIRVRAHAFGESRPARDLYLSPGHSVCVDFFGETLVPVGRLANGATITQVDVDKVTYWHVELDGQDILLAENLPCESYIDCGTRAFFAESDVIDLAAVPDAPALTTDDYCRPFHPEGALVDFAQERLSQRASDDLGWRLEVADPLAGVWLEVDGRRVVPHCDGLVARVTLPAAVRDIVLCSDSAIPADIHGARDERRLGLQLASLVADDGLHWRCEIACTDERLVDGFHPHEGVHRWTDGRARLPSELWVGARDAFVLRLAFAGPALPRWIAPAAVTAEAEFMAA